MDKRQHIRKTKLLRLHDSVTYNTPNRPLRNYSMQDASDAILQIAYVHFQLRKRDRMNVEHDSKHDNDTKTNKFLPEIQNTIFTQDNIT